MRLMRDEQACLRILDDFVARRVNAAVFMARFRQQWQCDGAEGLDGVPAPGGAPPGQAAVFGLLESIDGLCSTYAHNLPSGCGYRVSEEQFRKEVASLADALPHPGADRG